jgi:predicted O-methyltransferase YrrM
MSASYIAAALKENGQGGRLATLEGSPYRQKVARQVHQNLGLDNVQYVLGNFINTLDGALQELGIADLVFIDGHHQLEPTLRYFSTILPLSAGDAVFVFDDIRWSQGMQVAWSRLQANENLGLLIDLGRVGIAVRRQSSVPERFVLPPIAISLS